MTRDVVITSAGVVSPFGIGIDPLWDGLCSGETRIGPIAAFDASGFASRQAAEIPELKARDFVPKSYRKAVKVMARDIEIAVVAADEAVRRAGLLTRAHLDEGGEPTYAPHRVGCQIGAGLIATELDEINTALASAASEGVFSYAEWGERGMHNLTPLWMLKYLPNMLACHVTIIHDARGPSNTITCAEASGGLSIGESLRVIERGDADAAFAGGAESKVNPLAFIRMQMVKIAAELAADEDALDAVKPYDPSSRGSVVGEAGGILILEALDTARARGATPLARVAGFGAGHTPFGNELDLRSDGLIGAIEAALRDAGLSPDDIDAAAVNASGIPRDDEAEAHTLRRVFGDRTAQLELLTLTPAIGNAIAGQGAVSAAVAARAIAEQKLPARLHRGNTPKDIRAEAASARDATLRHVLVCSSSQGGQNAALILSAL